MGDRRKKKADCVTKPREGSVSQRKEGSVASSAAKTSLGHET